MLFDRGEEGLYEEIDALKSGLNRVEHKSNQFQDMVFWMFSHLKTTDWVHPHIRAWCESQRACGRQVVDPTDVMRET